MSVTAVPEPDPTATPDMLRPLVDGALGLGPDGFDLRRDPTGHDDAGRRAAVLMLFGTDPAAGPDVLLTERAATLRSHAGQVAFPGGRQDPGDTGPVGTALREAQEETGLDPAGVVPLAVLPELFIPPTGFVVTPVLAHWASPSPVGAIDPGEVARVVRVPVGALTDPANRFTVRGPSGYLGPAFRTDGLLVWGFTAILLAALLQRAGWERPWDDSRIEDLDDAWAAARLPGEPARNETLRNDQRGERVTDPVDVSDEVGR